MRDRDTIFKELKAYTEGLAYKEKLMAEGKAVVVTPEQRRETIELLCDTLELLKAQGSVEPIERNGFYYCGACRYAFTVHRQKYCTDCGRKVKWE